VVSQLIEKGEATSEVGFRVRLAAFGTRPARGRSPFLTVGLGHISEYLQALTKEHWDALSSSHFSDPVYGSLMLMEKARRAEEM
jgi:hypothetical protein